MRRGKLKHTLSDMCSPRKRERRDSFFDFLVCTSSLSPSSAYDFAEFSDKRKEIEIVQK